MRGRTSRYLLAIGMMVGIMAGLLALPLAQAAPPAQDAPEVYAEAIDLANVRSGPGIDYPSRGQITNGTRYRVLAWHTRVPWLQIDVPDIGPVWAYNDLMTVQGDLADVPAVNDFPPIDLTPPTAIKSVTPTATVSGTLTAAITGTPATPTPTPSPTLQGPTATTTGEANIRFGPDVSYPVIVKVEAGRTFRILERHAMVPWLHIALDESPTGSGWIYRDIVEVVGDLALLPVNQATTFAFPTLTPTPQTVIADGAPWNGAPQPTGQLAATLGAQMHTYLVGNGYTPYGDRVASVFVLDLTTGDTFTLNGNMAFSGMSLTKIPILAAYFQRFPMPVTWDEAQLVVDTMMCSENLTTNAMLGRIGDGDTLVGAQRVTAFLQRLGLNGTFILREYVTNPAELPPAGGTLTTGANQTQTRPDPANQVVPADLGWLLAGIYQCAADGTGLLVEHYPDDFDTDACRRMLYAMDANEINVFLEGGVPRGTRVIHKHGWIDDTHGDAGIVIGPNGAYVFVAALYAREWLEFDNSVVIIGELARMAWNHFNPQTPMATTNPGIVPDVCEPEFSPAVNALLSTNLPMLGP